MKIQAYSPRDREGILKLYEQFNEDRVMAGTGDAGFRYLKGDLPCWAQTLDDVECRTLVAREKDIVLGFITVRIPQYNPFKKIKRLGELDLIVVERTLRRRGIGTLLLNSAMRYFSSKHVTHVLLNVTVKNFAAMRFWVKMGFQKVSKSDFRHSDGGKEAIIYMMKKTR
jgi:ribosomal protein S18 acetylase RimI-like enzyme